MTVINKSHPVKLCLFVNLLQLIFIVRLFSLSQPRETFLRSFYVSQVKLELLPPNYAAKKSDDSQK